MSKLDIFVQKMPGFFSRLQRLLEKAVDAPRIMWENAGSEPGGKMFISFALLTFAASILYVIYSFITSSWREKWRMLITALIVAIVLFAILWSVL